MKLSDLRVESIDFASTPEGQRPASVADLVAALIAEGGEIVQTQEDWTLSVYEPGSYLIYGPVGEAQTEQ